MDESTNIMIDTELLIKAVKRHPALYKKSDPTYFHKSNHKPKIWHEVCREVLPNWENLKPQDQVGLVFQIQKRWKNLRTCFGRELLLQKQEAQQKQQNLPVKPRKVYGYYKKLSFLIEDDDGNEDGAKTEGSDDDYDPLVNFKTEAYEMEHEVTMDMAPETYVQAFEPIRSNDNSYANLDNRNHNQSTDGKVIEYLKNVKKDLKKDEEDEDKQFLMSLVPTFRKLNDKQKFEARIEILKALKEISFQNDAGPSS